MGYSVAVFLCLHYIDRKAYAYGRYQLEAKKKRLTLDIDPPTQRRLKVIATLKGISMRRYCLTAYERELEKDEANGAGTLTFGDEALRHLLSLQEEVFRAGRFLGTRRILFVKLGRKGQRGSERRRCHRR